MRTGGDFVSRLPKRGPIVQKSLKTPALDSSTNSDTYNDRDASSSESFLAICSCNQSDEDLAMSTK